MAPRAGEAVQTPSSGNSVQGEVDQKSASRGVGRQVPGPQDRSGGRGGSRLAVSKQWRSWAGGSPRRWRGSRNRARVGCEPDRRPGTGERLPDPLLTPMLLMTRV